MKTPVGSERDRILKEVRAALEREPRINLHKFPVEADFRDGVLTLEGEVEHVAAIIVRVHRALEQLGTGCSLAEVVTLCPELTWNEVFLAIDDLSRAGQVRVTLDGDRTYRVQAPHAVPVTASPAGPAP